MAKATKNKRRPRSVGEWFNSTTEYFEYMFHQFVQGVGQVFSGIGALIMPRRFADKWRKRSAQRAARGITEESKMGKTVEKMEDRFHVAVQGISSTFGDVLKLFIPTKLIESTEKAVSTKTKSAFWDIRYRFRKFAERITPKWLQSVFTKLNDRFGFIFKFTNAWFRTRDYVALAWSLPALLFALPILVSMIGGVVYSSNKKMQYYHGKLEKAIEARNESKEELCFRRLEQLGYQQLDRTEYSAALALADEENWDKAIEEMQKLAPLEEPGLPMAHLWLARQIANGKVEVDDPWVDFEKHARHARAQSVGRYRSLRLPAERYLVEAELHFGRRSEATALMLDLVAEFPELNAHLMEFALDDRDTPKARMYARPTFSRFERMHRDDPSREWRTIDLAHWAIACRQLGHNTQLIQVMELGRQQYPDDTELTTLLNNQFSERLAEMTFSEVDLVTLLEKAFDVNPNDQLAIGKLLQGLRSGTQPAIQCMNSLEQKGKLPAEVFINLGDDAIKAGDSEPAVAYYERALRLDPSKMRAWNNLAHILCFFEPTNYKRALQAVDKALELKEDFRTYETKGQILFRMERWAEAISYLEKGLNGILPDPVATHTALAKSYEQLGNTEQAAAHRQQAGLTK